MKRFFILSVLGSSTGKSNQIFKLPIVPDEIWIRESKRKPIRVWSRTRTFDNVAPLEELFIVKQDDVGNYWVQFGDGKTGAKLPSGIDNVIAVGKVCLERLWPDVTIILDVDLATSAARMERELDRMEQKGDGYHKQVREGFRKLADIIDNCIVIDASKSIEQVHHKVLEQVEGIT